MFPIGGTWETPDTTDRVIKSSCWVIYGKLPTLRPPSGLPKLVIQKTFGHSKKLPLTRGSVDEENIG